jgi:zinc protease
MNLTKSLLSTLVLGGTLSLSAQNIKYEEYTLDNGLHVILHEDRSTPIVAVTIMYHVGSKNENPERTGFAHFFEHLLFEGSANIARGEFDKYIEKAGGTLNANTSNDRTFYYEVLPSNELKLGLWLESERLLHAKVETIGIETQREVVKEEKRQRVDNQPYGSFISEIMKRAYTVHPYRWPVIGAMEHLDAATEEDYVGFYKTYYVPNNAVLSIAGDIDIKQTKQWIKEYFGSIPKGNPVPKVSIVEPPLKGEIRDTIYDNITLPAVMQAYRIPAQGTPDYYAVDMLAQVMSQGESSRLTRRLVNDTQVAQFVGAFPFGLEDPGLTITFGLANDGIDPMEVEKLMNEEFEKVKSDLITELEFEKLMNQIEANFVSSNSSMVGIAESLANYHMYFGNANLINKEIERYRKVTREDIQRVAKQYFHKDNRITLYYLPKAETAE